MPFNLGKVRRFATRGAALTVLLAAFAVSCSSGSDKASIAGICKLNSDCASGLVCGFGLCHAECANSRDCTNGAQCVASDNGKVCQLAAESTCSNGNCSPPLVCAPNGACLNACRTAADCIGDQVCVFNVCAEPADVDSTGHLKGHDDAGSSVPDASFGAGGQMNVGAGGATAGGSPGAGGKSGVGAGGKLGDGAGGVPGTGGASNDAGGPCGPDFAHATPLSLGETISATMPSGPTGACYYRVTASPGQLVTFGTQARPADDPFNSDYLDTVVTLFDAKQTQIARDDDDINGQTNDSLLYTALPTAGTYYLVVQDCYAAYGSGTQCDDPSVRKNFAFQVEEEALTTAVKERAEPNSTPPSQVTTLSYSSEPPGATPAQFTDAVIAGKFDVPGDIDVYAAQVQGVGIAPGSRPVLFVRAVPGGTSGDGSQQDVLPMWLEDSANLGVKLAQSKTGSFAIDAPVIQGHLYYLYVTGSPPNKADFYFIYTGGGSGPPIEQEVNDTPVQAETLTPLGVGVGAAAPTLYGVDGNISSISDVDWFSFPVAGKTSVSVICSAANIGSGLQSFGVNVFRSDGVSPVQGGSYLGSSNPMSSTETSDGSFSVTVPPESSSTLLLRISALSQDPNITGTYYSCQVQTS